jgi:hypothetical protein
MKIKNKKKSMKSKTIFIEKIYIKIQWSLRLFLLKKIYIKKSMKSKIIFIEKNIYKKNQWILRLFLFKKYLYII